MACNNLMLKITEESRSQTMLRCNPMILLNLLSNGTHLKYFTLTASGAPVAIMVIRQAVPPVAGGLTHDHLA